ncbi:hypothetical protein D3C72_1638090 [compost metagenome]
MVIGVVEAHQGRIILRAGHVFRHGRQVAIARYQLAVDACDLVVDAAQGVGLEAVERYVRHFGHHLAIDDGDALGQRPRRRQQGAVIGHVGRVERIAVDKNGIEQHQHHQRDEQPAQQLAAQATQRPALRPAPAQALEQGRAWGAHGHFDVAGAIALRGCSR